MSVIKTRIGGQVVETDDANLAANAQAIGQPTPTTPATAAAVGGTADAAKMAGTPAQTAPVLEQAVKPADTLQTAQRTDATAKRQESGEPEKQAAEKAAKLQTLGSLNMRVEAMISNELKLKNAATAQVSDTVLQATLPPALQTQAKALLQSVLTNPQDMTAQAAAAQFWADNGLGTFDPQKYVAQGAEGLGNQAASQVADAATLETLPLEQAEQTALSELLGDSWKTLTVPQLQQKIQDMRQSEFSRVQGLRAQLATAQGAQRQQILQELNAAGQTGVTGTEATVQDLQKQVDAADTVSIGGEDFKIGDLLKDEEISNLVTRMLGDKKLAAEVAKSNPEFAKWVSDNAKGLGELAKGVQAGTGALNTIQDQKSQLATVGDGLTLNDKVMRALVPDWDKVSSGVPTVTAGLYGVLKDPKLDEGTRAEIVSALTRASDDPALLKKLAGQSAADFKMSFDLAQQVEDNPLLASLVGLGADEGFVLDPAKQKEIMKFKPTADALEAAKKGAATGYLKALEDPALQELIKSGEFGPDQAKLLAAHPERLTQYTTQVKFQADLQAASKAGDIDKALDLVFGRDVDLASLNDEYARASRALQLDPGNAEARKRMLTFNKLDINRDGKIDKKDAKGVAVLGMRDGMPDGSTQLGLDETLKKGVTFDLAKEYDSNKLSTPFAAGNLVDSMEKYLSDGKVTNEELMSADESVLEAFMRNTTLADKYGYSREGVKKLRDKKVVEAAGARVQSRIADMGFALPAWNPTAISLWVSSQTRGGKAGEMVALTDWLSNQAQILAPSDPVAAKYYHDMAVRIYDARAAAQYGIDTESKQKADAAAEAAAAEERRTNMFYKG